MAIGLGSSGAKMIDLLRVQSVHKLATLALAEPLESYDEIKNILEELDIVFICTELGDETGLLAVPAIVRLSKAANALTIALVIKPSFPRDNEEAKIVEDALVKLDRQSDAVVIIPEEIHENKERYKIINEVISAVLGVLPDGKNDIDMDLSDLRLFMQGRASVGVGKAEGEDSWARELANALDDFGLDRRSLSAATSIMVHFKTPPDYQLSWINEMMQKIAELTDEETSIFFATSEDESLSNSNIAITVIACSCKASETLLRVNNI